MDIDLVSRFVTLLVLAGTLSISACYRRKARQTGDVIRRRAEGLVVLLIRSALGLALLGVLLLNVFYPAALSWTRIGLPAYLRWIGVGLSIACVPVLHWVFRSIGRNISETALTKQDHELVTDGPYRWVRHPLYSVSLLLLFALAIGLADGILLAGSVGAAVLFRSLVIPAEEARLIAAFGQEYRDYRRRTGALFPRLG